MAKYLVGIDAGHGPNTGGKRTPLLTQDLVINGKVVRKKGKCIHENEWNRGVAKYLASALKRCGIDYYYTADMTGSSDTPLSTRASRANAKKCDIFVSCHYNAYGGCGKFLDRKGGLLVLRTKNCSSKSIKLGKLVADQLKADIKTYKYSYGLMRDVDMSGFTLAVLRQTNMPAILIEYGFMDVWHEAKLMLDPAHQKKCAESTCKAICKYFGITYKKPNSAIAINPTTKPSVPSTVGKVNVKDFLVEIASKDGFVNVRTGPGVKYDQVVQDGKKLVVKNGGVYTITHTNKDGTWGFLKSEAGWICIGSDYVKKK